MVFETFRSTRDSPEHILLLPEAVVLSVRTEDMESFEGDHVPAEFLEPPEGDEVDGG